VFDRRLVVSLVSAFVVSAPITVAAESGAAELGYGTLLFKLAVVLGGVCLLAWVSLRWGLSKFVSAGDQGSAMRVVARTALEPRRTLLVVQVGSRHLLLASSESGVEKIAELDAEDAAAVARTEDTGSFADALRRVAVSRETSGIEEAT